MFSFSPSLSLSLSLSLSYTHTSFLSHHHTHTQFSLSLSLFLSIADISHPLLVSLFLFSLFLLMTYVSYWWLYFYNTSHQNHAVLIHTGSIYNVHLLTDTLLLRKQYSTNSKATVGYASVSQSVLAE